jgi:5-(carboxyamino)imidazole ribonucleotide mutase
LYPGIDFYFLIFIYLASDINITTPENIYSMEAKVSIIMGSTSDMPIMEEAAKILNEFQIHFEIHALSAHRTPDKVMEFAKNAYKKGIRVIIAGAGGAAHLPGVIAALTPIPVIGVPIKAGISIDGWDSILSILQMPPGVPVATVGLNSAMNAGILAIQIIAAGDVELMKKVMEYKARLAQKIEKANTELAQIKFDYKVN